jgi:hypothetical protein
MGPDTGWTQVTRDRVESKQREAYRVLGDKLGISGTPLEIQRKLFRTVTPPAGPDDVDLSRLPGYASFTSAQLKQFNASIQKSYLDALQMQLPTPYEDRLRYPIILTVFNAVHQAMRREGRVIEPQPVVATLPLGDVNAIIEDVPGGGAKVVYLDQGLIQFIVDYAAVVAWAIPSLSEQELTDDRAMARLPNTHTMPFQASSLFSSSLYAYVLSGTPVTEPSQMQAPHFNHFATVTLTLNMLRFVIAHELRHAEAGDHPVYGKNKANQAREYDADRSGAALVCKMTSDEGASSSVGYWACDLVLCIFNILYRALGVLKFGDVKLTWVNKDYPDPLSRRNRLKEIARDEILTDPSPLRLAVVGQLCGMTEVTIQKLWELSGWMLVRANNQGAQLSPIWTDQVYSSIAKSDL